MMRANQVGRGKDERHGGASESDLKYELFRSGIFRSLTCHMVKVLRAIDLRF